MRILKPCLIMVGILFWPGMVSSAVEGIFTDGAFVPTFDYGPCNLGGGGGATDCRDVENDGTHWSWSSPTPVGTNKYTELTTAAASPDGDNTYGLRSWDGDGDNILTGELRIDFGGRGNFQQEKEIWMRWYMRYEAGYAWSSATGPAYDKWLRFWEGPDQAGSGPIVQPYSQPGWRVATTSGSDQATSTIGDGDWQTTFGTTSDGLFHMFEVHIKTDTNGTDGIAQMWVNGVKLVERLDMDWGGGGNGWAWVGVNGNQKAPANGGPAYVDISDIEIWKVTPPNISPDGDPWIGPLNGFSGAGSLPSPKSPTSVGVSFNDLIEDYNFTIPGSYDKTSMVLANSGATSGSTKSIEYQFNSDATRAVR